MSEKVPLFKGSKNKKKNKVLQKAFFCVCENLQELSVLVCSRQAWLQAEVAAERSAVSYVVEGTRRNKGARPEHSDSASQLDNSP